MWNSKRRGERSECGPSGPFSVGGGKQMEHFRQGNSTTGRAFLESVLWQQSRRQVGKRQKLGGGGLLETVAAPQEEMRRLCVKTVAEGRTGGRVDGAGGGTRDQPRVLTWLIWRAAMGLAEKDFREGPAPEEGGQ